MQTHIDSHAKKMHIHTDTTFTKRYTYSRRYRHVYTHTYIKTYKNGYTNTGYPRGEMVKELDC